MIFTTAKHSFCKPLQQDRGREQGGGIAFIWEQKEDHLAGDPESEEEIVYGETEEANKQHITSQDKGFNLSSMKTDATPVQQQIRADIFKGLLITG